MKIGDPIWRFDQNRRVYKPGSHSPVWREHWVQLEVVGETTRSWLVGHPRWGMGNASKLPKNQAKWAGYATSEDEIEKYAWEREHGHKIAERVRHADYDQLRAIAAIMGYVP